MKDIIVFLLVIAGYLISKSNFAAQGFNRLVNH